MLQFNISKREANHANQWTGWIVPANLSERSTRFTTTTTNCPDRMTVREEMLLWQYIDGECSAEEQTEVRNLLEGNADFRNEFERMLSLHQKLQTLFASNNSEDEE